jgi:hypothetical protein
MRHLIKFFQYIFTIKILRQDNDTNESTKHNTVPIPIEHMTFPLQ